MTAIRCVLFLVCGVALTAAHAEDRPARGRTLLFVDDHEVLYRSGTRRELHPAKRRGAPIVTEDKPWEIAIGWSSIYRNPQTGKYQLWYQAYNVGQTEDRRLQWSFAMPRATTA